MGPGGWNGGPGVGLDSQPNAWLLLSQPGQGQKAPCPTSVGSSALPVQPSGALSQRGNSWGLGKGLGGPALASLQASAGRVEPKSGTIVYPNPCPILPSDSQAQLRHKSFSPTQCQHSPCAEGMCACATRIHAHRQTCTQYTTHTAHMHASQDDRVQMVCLTCTLASPRTQVFRGKPVPPPRAPASYHHDKPGPRLRDPDCPGFKPGISWSPSLCGPDASLPPCPPHSASFPKFLLAPRGAVLTSQTCLSLVPHQNLPLESWCVRTTITK